MEKIGKFLCFYTRFNFKGELSSNSGSVVNGVASLDPAPGQGHGLGFGVKSKLVIFKNR